MTLRTVLIVILIKATTGAFVNNTEKFLRDGCRVEKNLTGTYGILTSPDYPIRYPGVINCTWYIKPSNNTWVILVITDVDNFECAKEECCDKNVLTIWKGSEVLKKSCGGKENLPLSLRISGDRTIRISFIATSITTITGNARGRKRFRLIFSIRNKTVCDGYDLSCYDERGCYNANEICDSRFTCPDHSDEINCAKCEKEQAPCSNYSNSCFDPSTQRCDGIRNCPDGEDEDDCPEICPGKIRCDDNNGCYRRNQICDGKTDCLDGSDEIECTPHRICDIPLEKSQTYYVCNNRKCINFELIENKVNDCDDFSDEDLESSRFYSYKPANRLVVMTAMGLVALFIATICRWCRTRRDIRRFMENPPEFPLPPYRSPGENSQRVFSRTDFLHGGEIYEAFVNIRDRLDAEERHRSRRSNASPQRQRQVFTNTNPSCGVLALASLGVTPDSCVSLDNTDFVRGCKGRLCEVCNNKNGRNESRDLSGSGNRYQIRFVDENAGDGSNGILRRFSTSVLFEKNGLKSGVVVPKVIHIKAK